MTATAGRDLDGMRPVIMLTNAIAPDKLGGLERYVRELSTALAVQGREVTIVTKQMDAGDPEIETDGAGVRIVRHRVPSKSNPLFPLAYPLSVARTLGREVYGHRGSVVHGHYPVTTLPLVLQRRRQPFVYTFHNPVYKEVLEQRNDSYFLPAVVQQPAVRCFGMAEGLVLKRAKKVFTLSSFTQDEACSLSGIHGGGIQIVPGGIRTDYFTPGPPERDSWSRTATPLLFTARRFTARTGVVELIRGFALFRRRFPEALLAIAGGGALLPDIENEIGQRGLKDSVRLLGVLGDAELLRWYRAADLTCMPTQEREGFGLTTGESLACGTPVFVTPVGANPEVVAGLSPLLLSSAADPESMCRGLVDYFSAPAAVREDVRAKARAQVHPRWSWANVASTYARVYDQPELS